MKVLLASSQHTNPPDIHLTKSHLMNKRKNGPKKKSLHIPDTLRGSFTQAFETHLPRRFRPLKRDSGVTGRSKYVRPVLRSMVRLTFFFTSRIHQGWNFRGVILAKWFHHILPTEISLRKWPLLFSTQFWEPKTPIQFDQLHERNARQHHEIPTSWLETSKKMS